MFTRKILLKTILLFTILILSNSKSLALTYDFKMINNTTVTYTTGENTVDVHTEFRREVLNKEYFFSTKGEKLFHIPDATNNKDYEIELERQYKIDSLKVTSGSGKSIPYSIEELDLGSGIYIKVPNYKQTVYGSPYIVNVYYKTHSYVRVVRDWVAIQIPSLHEDTVFEQIDEDSKTKTKIDYNLDVVVNNNISTLAKIFPEQYKVSSDSTGTRYSFSGNDRVGVPVYLEFGTEQVYKFEINLTSPKTDTLIPEKYSSVIGALSTNIYQIPLPREFAETNQRVKIEEIIPKPTKITMDLEGNIIGTFEVPANQDSKIFISGYIWVEQEPYSSKRVIPNLTLSEYKELINKDPKMSRYLASTNFWEIDDPFISSKSKELSEDTTPLIDTIRSFYLYINDVLDYDYSKAEGENVRVGAKTALKEGKGVCMEYSDSMIALLRAQGIPSRASIGYVGLNTLPNQNKDNTPHQWVQIWVPEYGWLSVDPTYESVNIQIGQNIDSILWETFYDNSETNLGIYTADKIKLESFTKDNYSIRVYAIDESSIPEVETLLSYADITIESDNTIKDSLNIFIKTTTLGKAFIVILPISIVLILLVILFSLITLLVKRSKSRKASPVL